MIELNEFCKEAAQLGGWLAFYEGELFRQWVINLRYVNGVIVEIGSYVGKSSIYFARGLSEIEKDTDNKYIYCIDPFLGSIEHAEWAKEGKEGFEGGSTFNAFIRNTKRFEVYDNIIPIATTSDKVAKFWSLPIKILFIDGAHDNDAPFKDYVNFSKFVVNNGLVIFHDSDLPEVQEAIGKCIEDRYELFYKQGALTVYKKIIYNGGD